MQYINHILSGEHKSHGYFSFQGRGCDSGARSPATPLSLWRTGIIGVCRQLATSFTVAELELEPGSWCPAPRSSYHTICFSKGTDFMSVIKQAAENRHVFETKIRFVC